jgi:phosphoribosyl 1,2-cyclic phosphate phosphodiesterase
MEASLIILGSGTSMGVPTLGCDCRVCTSADPRDRRLRPSAAVVWPGEGRTRHVIIDTGPDFRAQALAHNIQSVDAVLYTHSHADHILGMDDLRPLSYKNEPKIPLYADDPTARVLETIFDYTFSEDSQYKLRARVQMNRLNGAGSVAIHGANFQRVPLLHGPMETGGYRFGNAAYLTDMNAIPDTSLSLLDGVEVVVIDALRERYHPSHANIDEAVAWVDKIGARQAWFTHMSHEILHAEVDARLPAHIRLAYDGLAIPIELGASETE